MQEPSPTHKVPPEIREFATGYFSQVKAIILSPKVFFDSMPTQGGLFEPLKFFAVAVGVDVVMSSLTTFNLWVAFTKLILLPVGLLLIALLANCLSQMMGGKGQFEGTMRVYAYSSATLLVGWIPIINFVAALYGWALYFWGLKKVHELDTGKALVVMFVSGIVWFVIMMLGACGAAITMILSRLH